MIYKLLCIYSQKVRSPTYRVLNDGVEVLYLIWGSTGWSEWENHSSKNASLALAYSKARNRSRRVLEHLFRTHSYEVFESIINCWNQGYDVCISSSSIQIC